MALTLTFDGPDADRATRIHATLSSDSPDDVSRELVDRMLEIAAGCADRALTDSEHNPYLLAPVVVDAGLAVRLVVPGGEDAWLTVGLPEELRREIDTVPVVQLTGLWVQSLAALHRLEPYATPQMEQLVLLCAAAATIGVLDAESAVDGSDGDGTGQGAERGARAVISGVAEDTAPTETSGAASAGAATDPAQIRIREIRESWKDHGELDIDRDLVEVLFSLATQTLEAALAAHGAETLLLPVAVKAPSVTTGFTTWENMSTTGTSKTTAVVPQDATAPARLQVLIGGDANLANALWFDVLTAATEHLARSGTAPRETLSRVLDGTGDCLAAAEIVGLSRG